MNTLFIAAHPDNYTRGRGGQKIIAIVDHIMLGTMAGTKDAFQSAGHQASAHYGVGRDGGVVQYVEDEDTAYTNGNLRNPNTTDVPWLADFVRRRKNPNPACLTIEWEGQHGGGRWVKEVWGNAKQKLDTIERGSIREWWKPTEQQYLAGLELHKRLILRWDIPIDRAHICRHSDFDAVTRWFCPGDGFPQKRLLADLRAWHAAQTRSTPPPPGPSVPTTQLDGVSGLPVAVVQRLLDYGPLRLRMAGKVRRAGIWPFAGVGVREVVACEKQVLVALPELAAPDDVQGVHVAEAARIFAEWKL